MNTTFTVDTRDIVKCAGIIERATTMDGLTIRHDYSIYSLAGQDGFIVGGRAPGRIYNLHAGRDTLAQLLHKYVTSSPRFNVPTYVGLWLPQDGTIHFDIVDIVPNVVHAIDLARERGERAIYDIRNASDIFV